MLRLKVTPAAAIAAFILGAGFAAAQDAAIGAEIYQERCSVCHGETGAGDGIVAGPFDRKPRNLTHLAKENGGVFPFDAVYKAIDGRREIRAYGYSRMPIWGEYFMKEAISDPRLNPGNAREVTQGRILSVVCYLQMIQEE